MEIFNEPYLKIIMGPMYSGKSTEIIRLVRKYKAIDKSIMIVNHSSDNRYGEKQISTHNHTNETCYSLSNLDDVFKLKHYLMSNIIIIEEAQFFPKLYEFVIKCMETDKKSIIIAGLDGDFRRKPFGDILKLIPLCNEVIKLNALCKRCNNGTAAPFTKRTCRKKAQKLVGGVESYEAVCRKHYLEQ